MIGDGAAGAGDQDLPERDALQHGGPDLFHQRGIHAGMGDKDPARVHRLRLGQLVVNVAEKGAFQRAPVLFAHAHLAVGHLDAGLELEQIGAQRRKKQDYIFLMV